MTERNLILDGLEPLFEEAKRSGKWFWCGYQDLWFSPEKLRDYHERGQFIWSAENWRLRDPQERVTELQVRVDTAMYELERFKEQLAGRGT